MELTDKQTHDTYLCIIKAASAYILSELDQMIAFLAGFHEPEWSTLEVKEFYLAKLRGISTAMDEYMKAKLLIIPADERQEKLGALTAKFQETRIHFSKASAFLNSIELDQDSDETEHGSIEHVPDGFQLSRFGEYIPELRSYLGNAFANQEEICKEADLHLAA